MVSLRQNNTLQVFDVEKVLKVDSGFILSLNKSCVNFGNGILVQKGFASTCHGEKVEAFWARVCV